MRAIDYLSIFLLLGSAPTWQGAVDRMATGLGSALLLLLLLTAVRLVFSELRDDRRETAVPTPFNRAADCRRCRGCPTRSTPAA